MKILGVIGMLGIIGWVMSLAVGLGAFIDPVSIFLVFGGAVFFCFCGFFLSLFGALFIHIWQNLVQLFSAISRCRL